VAGRPLSTRPMWLRAPQRSAGRGGAAPARPAPSPPGRVFATVQPRPRPAPAAHAPVVQTASASATRPRRWRGSARVRPGCCPATPTSPGPARRRRCGWWTRSAGQLVREHRLDAPSWRLLRRTGTAAPAAADAATVTIGDRRGSRCGPPLLSMTRADQPARRSSRGCAGGARTSGMPFGAHRSPHSPGAEAEPCCGSPRPTLQNGRPLAGEIVSTGMRGRHGGLGAVGSVYREASRIYRLQPRCDPRPGGSCCSSSSDCRPPSSTRSTTASGVDFPVEAGGARGWGVAVARPSTSVVPLLPATAEKGRRPVPPAGGGRCPFRRALLGTPWHVLPMLIITALRSVAEASGGHRAGACSFVPGRIPRLPLRGGPAGPRRSSTPGPRRARCGPLGGRLTARPLLVRRGPRPWSMNQWGEQARVPDLGEVLGAHDPVRPHDRGACWVTSPATCLVGPVSPVS